MTLPISLQRKPGELEPRNEIMKLLTYQSYTSVTCIQASLPQHTQTPCMHAGVDVHGIGEHIIQFLICHMQILITKCEYQSRST